MKKIIAVIISLFCLTAVFAEDWYVCLGSFTKKENLDTYIAALDKNKIPNFTQPYTDTKGVKWTRVFYDEAFKNADTARMVRDSLQPKKVFKDFKMDGLWICQTTKPGTETAKAEPKVEVKVEPAPAKVETPKAETPKVETAPAKTETKTEPAKTETKTTTTKKTTTKKAAKAETKTETKTEATPAPAPVEPKVETKVETPAEPVVIEKSEKPAAETKPAEEKAVAAARKYSAADLDAALPFITDYKLTLVKHYNFNLISKYNPNYTLGKEAFIDDVREIADCMVTARYIKEYSTIDVNVCYNEERFPEIPFDGLEKVPVVLPEIDADCIYVAAEGNINTCFVMSSNRQILYGISGKNIENDQMVSILKEINGTKLVAKKTAVGSILETAPEMAKVMYTYAEAVEEDDSFISENPGWLKYLAGNWHEDSLIVSGDNFFFELGIDSDDADQLFEDYVAGTEGMGTVKTVNGKKVWFYGESSSSQREAVFADGNAVYFLITEASEEALLEEVSKR